MDNHKHISPIAYISHAYGCLLTHERNDHKLDDNMNRVHHDITVGFHNSRRLTKTIYPVQSKVEFIQPEPYKDESFSLKWGWWWWSDES